MGHAFSLLFVSNLFVAQTFCILNNITTNEMVNRKRYSHFWADADHGKPDVIAQWNSFLNPFSKGSLERNWLDFWWYRERSEVGPRCPKKVRELADTLMVAGA